MAAIQTFDIKPFRGHISPAGYRQTEFNRRESKWYKSDAVIVASGAVSQGATTNTLFRLPNNCIVVGGFLSVETAFDASGTSVAASCTVTVTNGTGTETLFDAANTALQSTGLKPCTSATIVSDTTGAPVATLLIDPGTSVQGTVRVYLEVVPLEDLL